MGVIEVSVAAATAVINYDMLSSSAAAQRGARMSNVVRVITGIGVCGSAAAGDCEVQIFVEDAYYGNMKNKATGGVTNDHILKGLDIPVPAAAQIRIVVSVAPGTNPLNVVIQTADYPIR